MNQTDIDCSWNFMLAILWGKKSKGSKSGFVGLTSCTWSAWPWTEESSCCTHDFQRETRTLCREDVRSKSASRRPPKATGRTCHRPQNVASARQLRLTCYHYRPRINSRWQRRLHEGHGLLFLLLFRRGKENLEHHGWSQVPCLTVDCSPWTSWSASDIL